MWSDSVGFAGQPSGERLEVPVGTDHASVAVALLREGVACWGRSASLSMTPLIRPSDRLLIQPLGLRKPRRGDLVAVHRDGVIVVHRVVATRPDGCWTKGDALLTLDAFVPKGEFLGRVATLELLTDRRISFDRFPWNAVQRGLGWVAWCAVRLCPNLSQTWLRLLVWRALRLPFYGASALARRRG